VRKKKADANSGNYKQLSSALPTADLTKKKPVQRADLSYVNLISILVPQKELLYLKASNSKVAQSSHTSRLTCFM
jgi:hypothetical protein